MEYQLTVADLKKFWSNIIVNTITQCWEWDGELTSDKGNGTQLPQMYLGGQKILAKRLSYLIHYGEMPHSVGNSCGNPQCVSPKHMEPAIHREKRIGKVFRTKKCDEWKRCTAKVVAQIFTLRKLGRTLAEIAKQTGVPSSRVATIVQMCELCKADKI